MPLGPHPPPVKSAQILSSLRGHVSLSGLQVLHTVVSSYKVWGYSQGGPEEKLLPGVV